MGSRRLHETVSLTTPTISIVRRAVSFYRHLLTQRMLLGKVRAQLRMPVRHGLHASARGVKVPPEKLGERVGSMEVSDLPRAVELLTDVVIPDSP